MSQVVCENPTIIVNPSLRDLISQYKNVTIKGKLYRYSSHRIDLYTLPRCVLPPTKRVQRSVLVDDKIKIVTETIRNIQKSDLENCFVTDCSTGQTFPVYLEVPCGKCDLCKNQKVMSFVERCKMETQCYDSLPWFVTLTYNDQNLPLDGVSVRDVQLFLKRFRINLVRSGFDFRIRYACCGEYGHNTHRPHYHLVLWGLDTFTDSARQSVSDLLESSWDKGFVKFRLIDPKDDKAFFYTAKYLRKDGEVPLFESPDGQMLPCNNFFYCNPAPLEV